MRTLEEEDDEAFKRQFSQYIKNDITADSVSVRSLYFIPIINRPTYNCCNAFQHVCSVAVGQYQIHRFLIDKCIDRWHFSPLHLCYNTPRIIVHAYG